MSSSVPPTTLLGWFDVHERDLPWREPGRSGWEILVSEIMLQQTPVARVLGPWSEWVRRWPTPSAMAAASPGEVLRAWGKLGYPRRALRLHGCAQVLAADYDDMVPDDVATLLELPGIGDYTARAVACFAYGRAVPVVDTNVRRVIARAVHGRAEPGNPSRRDLDDAEVLLPRSADGSYSADAPRFSAALMELGALVCTARNPACENCPLTDCRWVRRGRPAHTGPARTVQKFAGTDRQVRGLLLDVLRGSADPVPRGSLDAVWTTDVAQRDRALDSLLSDGLVETTGSGLFCLAGEAGPDREG
ncbi:A/G-specific adenine glycosylase [Gordonia pseudamarae]|jgi:A/G-specific adenine glycosylase|uniref:Adenine DNA glycosylase n=1 Tax=Gordonia pseudamarae TaxID=2831662 RepID=A0ABX6IN98_9ACTN|nr:MULTISPECIES: A/G-specific adenine glycosylase [Gordonia]MBD0020723.1 A/G-specific adenine glycosylase [Gordonia sp. (in: high G+C Gram-positive bacteria)]QHN27761.1 A/G-specific adenine glycosylase [Gordonia pseudamarae]QHN36643.1 A/G-specific adenine glycosylase [Gordonia pseudamarae]